MTDEASATFHEAVQKQEHILMVRIELESMLAANRQRESEGLSQAYSENDIYRLIDELMNGK